MPDSNILSVYSNKRVLITGGLGFLGSSLAHALVARGADVALLDNLAPLYGGNEFNIDTIKDQVTVTIGDIRDSGLLHKVILDCDFIFNFAAQVSHSDSATMPFEDLDINARGQLMILEACRLYNPHAKIIFPSSRLVFGRIQHTPVTEEHPTHPLGLYGVHKLTAEKYYQLYHHLYGMRTVVLRLTNPYGPRQQIKHSKYSIPGWFMRLAMEGKEISIFGEGEQKRDYIYVDDVVQSFLLVGALDITDGKVYNCGYGSSVAFKDMVTALITIVGSGNVRFVPWPSHYEKEETGSFEVDTSLLRRDTQWVPAVSLKEGLQRMCQYYTEYKNHYLFPESL